MICQIHGEKPCVCLGAHYWMARALDAEKEAEAAKQAWRDDREETKGERNAALKALASCEQERDEHRKAIGALSNALGNPALQFNDETSLSQAVVNFALARLHRAEQDRDVLENVAAPAHEWT